MPHSISSRDALKLWHEVSLEGVREDVPDLTARQQALLLTVYLTPMPHTVRGLSERLNIAKPAVTRALDTLSRHGYVRRKKDPEDLRNVLVQRTVQGSVYLRELGDRISQIAAGEYGKEDEVLEQAAA